MDIRASIAMAVYNGEKYLNEQIDSIIKAIGDKIADKKNVYFEIGAGSGLYTFGNGTFLNELIETVGADFEENRRNTQAGVSA